MMLIPIKIDPPILITGPARHGTSMVAGCFDKLGAFGGACEQRVESANPFGVYENVILKDIVNKGLIRYLGACPFGIESLPKKEAVENLPSIRPIVMGEILRQNYSGGPWYFKDAKMSYLWPVWVRSFPQAKWIICERNEEEAISSCLRWTLTSQVSTDPEYWRKWIRSYKDRLQGLKAYRVNTNRLIYGDFAEFEWVVTSCGIKWDEQIVKSHIQPKYWARDIKTGIPREKKDHHVKERAV